MSLIAGLVQATKTAPMYGFSRTQVRTQLLPRHASG
jgi:hypothetical protein